jgi:CBS-domain-containing membrane protein
MMTHMKARDIMSCPVITVAPDTPFQQIVTLLLTHRISGVPVVDEEGMLLGIVTEADLIRKEESPPPQPPIIRWHGASLWLERAVDRYQKVTASKASELMTENVVTASEETGVRELAHLMLSRGINRIPIVRDRCVVGIVTRADVLKVFERSDASIVSAVRTALAQDLWIDPADLDISCSGGIVTVAGQVDRLSDRELVVKWIRSLDGVVNVRADSLTYRIDDLALGRVTL